MPPRSATLTMAPAPLDAVPTPKPISRSRSNKKKTRANGEARQPASTDAGKRAQKRKLDISDEDDMNDFMPSTRPATNIDPQSHLHQSWSSRPFAGPRHNTSSETMPSITSKHDPAQHRPAKRFMEEDRGFVFARKKTTAPPPSISMDQQPRTITSKFLTDMNDAGNNTHPPTPERSPSKEMLADSRRYGSGLSKAKKSTQKQSRGSTTTTTVAGRSIASSSSAQPASSSSKSAAGGRTPTRIAESIVTIPMRETPMIKKNKDMRGDSRRTSFTLRGKRASSIGSGFEAQPHPAIDPKGFYRHISADLPDIARMKQLLAWCGRKSADAMTTATVKGSSSSALKVAKAVQEDVLNLVINNTINLSWYNRPQDPKELSLASNKATGVAKKPHKQNVENRKKLREYEEQMAKLKHEDEQWTRLISSYNTFHASILDSGLKLPPGEDEPIVFPGTSANDIEIDILSADERRLWEKHCRQHQQQSPHDTLPAAPATASKNRSSPRRPNRISLLTERDTRWIPEKMKNLESQVDDMRDKLYKASQFNRVARLYTDQVLEQVAVAMEKRQRPVVDMSTPYPLALTSSCSSYNATTSPAGHVSLPFPPPSSSVEEVGGGATSASTTNPSTSAYMSHNHLVASTQSPSPSLLAQPSGSQGGANVRTESSRRPPTVEGPPDTRDIMRQLSRLCI